MAIKVYSPIDFEDTSSGLSIDGDFAVDTNTLFVDVSTDRVGIGTTSPVSALDVNGVITLSGDTEHTIQRLTSSNITSETTHVTQIQGRQIDLFAYDDVWLRAGSTDNIGFVAGGSTRMYINRYGDVGIGTTSPTEELHIEGEVKIQPKHTSATPPSLYLGDLNNQFQSGMSSTGHLTFRSTSNTYFQTGGANYRMMIDSTGNVGIGTISPASKLHVVGDFFLKGSDTSSSTKNLQVQTGNGTSIMDFRNDAYAFFGCGQGGGSASGFIFRYNSTFGVQFTGYNYGNGTSPSYKPILMDTDLAGRSQGVYINYGITGYTAPAPTSDTEFAVRGRGTGSNYTAKFEDSSTNPLLYIKDNGNVTVGSSTDNGYKLDVEGNTNTNGDYYVNGNQGWSGTITINQSPNPPIDITVEGGIITNVT